MRSVVNRVWRQAIVVALLIGVDAAISLPIMGATYRPFSWMSIAPADATTLYPALPQLAVSPGKIKATGVEGSVPPNARFSVRIEGGGKRAWDATSSASWLTLVPFKGTSTGEWDRVAVVFRSEHLKYGSHTATVTISSATAPNGPIQVPVVLTQLPNRPPAAPRLLAPAATALVPFTNRLVFAWEPARRAQTYMVFAGKDGKPFTNVTVKGEFTTNLTVEAPFLAGVYTWMAMGLNNKGTGPWSTTVTFRVAERMMSPGGWERLAESNPPAFRWETTPGATQHQAWVAVYEAPLNPANPTNANGRYRTLVQGAAVRDDEGRWAPDGLTFSPASYRWQVREQLGGAWTAWSTPAYFRIAVPNSPKPVTPRSGTTSGKSPLFTWKAEPTPETVLFEIRVWKDGAIRKTYSDIVGSPFTPPGGGALPGRGAMSWQIRAFELLPDNSRHYSPWSTAIPFTVK
jgi:hypothetical protein